MSTRRIALSNVQRVRERPASDVPALVHPGWADAFPWLIQGTTTRGAPDRPFDFALFNEAADRDVVLAHWDTLRKAVGASRVVHARQVHGAAVRLHGPGAAGLHIVDDCDGHATTEPGVLMAVTTADCVPAFLVDPRRRAVAVAHAGWRGTAAGVLERAVSALSDAAGEPLRGGGPRDGRSGGEPRAGPSGGEPRAVRADVPSASRIEDIHLHLGPAICGACYEVGSEVFEALDLPAPAAAAPLDLRAVLAERAVSRGVRSTKITMSEHCTRCTDSGLFSHRGGDAARQVGYLGVLP